MPKIVRPLRFDNVRREAHNKKRREARRRREAERHRLARSINSMLWFGIEPPTVWDNLDWNNKALNDNEE